MAARLPVRQSAEICREDGVVATLCIWVGRRGTVRLPNGTTWLLKWVSQRHIHTHYLVR
jgi:hypothetical protein